MNKLFWTILVVAPLSFAQQGAMAPALPPAYTNGLGAPAANGRLCTTVSGTETPLAVFADPNLTQPLPNPIRLNAAGQPQTQGGASTAIYLQARSYRFTLYAFGTGNNRCNGQAVGAIIWQRDNVYDYGQTGGGGNGGGGGGSMNCGRDCVYPQQFGAKADGITLGGTADGMGCSGTAGNATITCAGANFTSTDVGKTFDLAHAGMSNCGPAVYGNTTTMFNCNLVGTITMAGSATSVTLSTPLINSVTNEQFMYASSDDAAILAACQSDAKTIELAGTYGITARAGVACTLRDRTVRASGSAIGRFMRLGPVAYDGLSDATFTLLNGSRNVTFENVGFIGSNALGELTTFGPTHDGLALCSGIPNNNPGGWPLDCGPLSGMTNLNFINCDFSHMWGIGFHSPDSGTAPGQQMQNVLLAHSRAFFNSYDGFNPIVYDGLIMLGDQGSYNGTGGLEVATYGSMTITGGVYSHNKAGGIAAGGIVDPVLHGKGCQITGNDLSDNGNGYLPNTVGTGLALAAGTQDCTASSNTIRHNHNVGILMAGSPQDMTYTITGNVISSNGIYGASVQTYGIYGTFYGVTLSGNRIIDEATNQIVSASRTSNVVTVQTTLAHNYLVGYSVVISGTPGGIFDGTFPVSSIVDGRTFTFVNTGANAPAQAGGETFSSGSGFLQEVGLGVQDATHNQFLHNTILNNRNVNVYFGPYTFVDNLFVSESNTVGGVLPSGAQRPDGSGTDIRLEGGWTPSAGTLKLVIPDIQTTVQACTTPAAAGAICTTAVNHGFGYGGSQTSCTLRDMPNAQTGHPMLLKVSTVNMNQATATIGSFDGAAAGGGTMVCKTNFNY